ncbi:MAG TPA: phage terminase small subunit P27 family [Candidatus Eremiobacteraceae bacterium]|nr:phage terminase small subunit P27 family [Candidatus Eremiobacteraceae bacterium]
MRGTAKPSRELRPTALERFKVAPAAPDHLSERAKAEWDALALVCTQIGVLTPADLRSLELLAEILAGEGELRALLAAEGMTIPGAAGNSKTHPAARLLESTRNQAQKLLGDFGLTPRGRLGVDLMPAASVNRFHNNGLATGEKYSGPHPWDHPTPRRRGRRT